ncbi:MAG: OmpH family outer membrane protein [Herbaspirillum sp.]
MTKSLLSIQAVALTVGILSCVNAQAQNSKIAFVSTERIFREATPAKAAQSKLEAEFSRRERDIQDLAARLKIQSDRLDKDATVLSESERIRRQRDMSDLDKEFQRKQREFREDLNQRRNEELSILLERTNKVIRQIAEAEKYDIVFQEAVFASKRIDITDKVLKELSK